MSVNLSPFAGAGAQFFTDAGTPLTGGLLYSYAAGTTTPATTYTDFGGTVANSNPIVLDAAGRVPYEIWLTAGTSYKFVLKTSVGTTVGTWDNIDGINDVAAGTDFYADAFTTTAGQTTFTLSANPGSINNLTVSLDGALLVAGDDFSWTGTTLVLTMAAYASQRLRVAYSSVAGVKAISPGSVVDASVATGSKLYNRIYDIVDVRDYGAVGDGVTDDTAAIAAALTAASAAGAILSLVNGATYLCSSWVKLTLSNFVRLRGNGSTIKGPASTTSFISPAAGFDIEGVTFDRWGSVIDRQLADGSSASEFRFYRNTCVNGTGIQIDWERPISDYWVMENRFESCSGGYALKVGENTYANQDNYLRGTIFANKFLTLSASSTTSCAAMLIYGRDVTITNNVIDGVQGAAGEGWGIYTKVRYGVISSNVIRNVNSTSSSDVVGLNIKGAPRSLTSSVQGFNVVAYGNQLYNIGIAGSKGGGIRAQCDDILVIGNSLENTGIAGIAADDSNGSRNIHITGNRIILTGTATDYGIRLECNGNRIRATNNTIDGPVGGILVGPPGAVASSDFEVSGNVIKVTAGGTAIPYSPFANLSYLKITDNVVVQASIGLQNNGGAGAWTNVCIAGNDLARATTPVSGTLPTGIVERNAGFMEGSATYDPASLNTGTGATTTVTCFGALLGDYASASFSLDLQGILVTAWVSSANTVTVRFQNQTGGTIDLGSGTLKVLAQRR